MSFKKWWKKLEYWKKGGIIGLVIGIVPYLVIKINGKILSDTLYQFILAIISIPAILMVPFASIGCTGEDCFARILFFGLIFAPVFYALLSALVGLIIDKLKKK